MRPSYNPAPDEDLARRLQRLEGTVRALTTQRVLQNGSADQSDGSVGVAFFPAGPGITQLWKYGPGSGISAAADGSWPQLLSVGQILDVGGNPAGSGVVAKRPDGTTALEFGTLPGNYAEATIRDRRGNPAATTDSVSGFGLANPWIPFPAPVDTNVARWPGTSAAAATSIAYAQGFLQHPVIAVGVQAYAPAGVTGQFQVWINGAPAGTSWTAANGGVTSSFQTITVASPLWHQTVSVEIYAQVTAGTGTVSAQPVYFYGRQT